MENGAVVGDKLPFGDHERAFVHHGRPDYREIIQTEVSGDYIKSLPNIEEELGESLVMGEHFQAIWSATLTVLVSASANIRDQVRSVVRDYLDRRVRMSELEFQP